MSATILQLNPLDKDDVVYDRKLQLSKEWKEDPFSFINLLNEKDSAIIEEKLDELFLEVMKNGDVSDKAYELRSYIENKQEVVANDIAWSEINE